MIFFNLSLGLIHLLSTVFLNTSEPIIQEATNPIQTLVQEEIRHTQTRSHLILNTWILATILVPGAATICVFIFLLKLSRNNQGILTEIQLIKSETISQMKFLLSSEKDLTQSLNQQTDQASANSQQIQQHIQRLSVDKNDEE